MLHELQGLCCNSVQAMPFQGIPSPWPMLCAHMCAHTQARARLLTNEETWTMRGLSAGRRLVEKMLATAAASSALAARPYTVSCVRGVWDNAVHQARRVVRMRSVGAVHHGKRGRRA